MTRNIFIAQAVLIAVGYAFWHFGYTVHIPYTTMAETAKRGKGWARS